MSGAAEYEKLKKIEDRTRKAGGEDGEMAAIRARLAAEEKHFEEKLTAVDAELAGAFAEWDKALETGAEPAARQKLLTRMNDILNRRSYIRNLVQNVQKELAEA